MLKSYIKLVLETYFKNRQIGNDLYTQDEDTHNILMRNKKNKSLNCEKKDEDSEDNIDVVYRFKSTWSQKPRRKHT